MRFPPKSGAISLALALASPATLLAQEASMMLEEVIVTAQKRSESLSDIAMTVNVISGDAMNDFANFSLSDLDRMTAGLTISGLGFDADIAVRGLGTNLNAPVDPRVAIYFDGVPIAREQGLFSGTFDLERFELLRGPQGTLYGKASPAGAITIESRGPNLEQVDGYIQQSFNEHSASNSQFGVSIPLIRNKLGLRLAGLYDTNENSEVKNITLGQDNENETWSGRAVLLWEPSDTFSARLSYTRIEDDFDIDLVVQGDGIDFDDRKSTSDWASTLENTAEYTILEINWELANEWLLTSASSLQDLDAERTYDSDGSEFQASEQTVFSNVPDTFNTELRLSNNGSNENWDWTAGVYYQDSDSWTPVFADTYITPFPGFSILAATTGPADITTEHLAVFIHNAFHFTESDTLTLGLRYNDIERKSEQAFTISVYPIPPGLDGPPIQVRELDGIPPEDQDLSDNAWTGTLKYQHRFNDALMAYASYDRGWRDGSANVAGRAEPPAFGAFDAEDSDNFELGLKWNLLDGRGLLNLAAYYQIYTDFQYQANGVEYRSPPADGFLLSLANPVVNVDEVESWGAEADFTVLITETWTMNLSATYNQTEFTDAPSVPCTTGEDIPFEEFYYNSCDLEGERAGKLPEWSGVITTEYWQPLGESGNQWYLRSLVKAESEYYSQGLKDDLDSYATMDLHAGLRAGERQWDASIWVRNLFDETAILDALPLQALPDTVNGGTFPNPYTHIQTQLPPRTVGMTASWHF